MPIIKTYEKDEATGDLLKIYEEIIRIRGDIDNNAKLFSISPYLLNQQLDFIKYYSTHPTLSMPLLASIRISVSNKENCKFCVDFNTALLINFAKWSFEDVEKLKEELQSDKLTKEENAILTFVIKAMINPHNVNQEDINKLKEMDWEEKDIFDALNHAARMYATDILFNAFKIEDYKN